MGAGKLREALPICRHDALGVRCAIGLLAAYCALRLRGATSPCRKVRQRSTSSAGGANLLIPAAGSLSAAAVPLLLSAHSLILCAFVSRPLPGTISRAVARVPGTVVDLLPGCDLTSHLP